jgi:hypothetical protein
MRSHHIFVRLQEVIERGQDGIVEDSLQVRYQNIDG